MVTINFTLVIELGLFLVFLWGAARFIVRPALRVTDAREEEIEKRKAEAEVDLDEAERIEERYAGQIADFRRASEDEFRAGRRTLLQEHAETLGKHRIESDAAIEAARLEALAQVDAARAEVADLAPELAQAIERQLGIGDPS